MYRPLFLYTNEKGWNRFHLLLFFCPMLQEYKVSSGNDLSMI